MVIQMFTIYDRLAEEYMPPFTAKNSAIAFSLLDKAVVDAKEDSTRFELFSLGEYDTDYGMIVSHKPEKVDAADEDID